MIDRTAGKLGRTAAIALVAGIALLGACDKPGAAGGHPATKTDADFPQQTVEVTGQAAVAGVPAVKSITAVGNQQTGAFTVAGAWKLSWVAGAPLTVRVIDRTTAKDVKDVSSAVNGETVLSGSCDCYLQVSSEMPYTVTVTDLPN